MKKAKLMLAAIAVLAVSGSVIAVQAAKKSLTFYYTSADGTGLSGSATQYGLATITTNDGVAEFVYYTTAPNSSFDQNPTYVKLKAD